MKRPLEIRTGHRPFQLTVMVSGMLSGAAGVAFPQARSNAVADSFPKWMLIGYYASLMVWCGLVTCVTATPDRVKISPDRLRTRMLLESAGLCGMGFACAAYGVAAVSFSGVRALTVALFVGMFGAAALWRAFEIRTDLRKLSSALANPARADPPPLADPEED